MIRGRGSIEFDFEVTEEHHLDAILMHLGAVAKQLYPHNLSDLDCSFEYVIPAKGPWTLSEFTEEPPMPVYRSKPTEVEAVQNTTDLLCIDLDAIAPDKWRWNHEQDVMEIKAGKDGAQDWVPVPEGHWIVRQPGDPSDIWPVDPDYFAAKYDEVT